MPVMACAEGVSFERPKAFGRIHWSCDGTIELAASIPLELLRSGDTASAAQPGSDKAPWVWRLEDRSELLCEWVLVEAWTQAKGAELVNQSNFVIVLGQGVQRIPYVELGRTIEKCLRNEVARRQVFGGDSCR